jgi:hypothetical protein
MEPCDLIYIFQSHMFIYNVAQKGWMRRVDLDHNQECQFGNVKGQVGLCVFKMLIPMLWLC